MDQIVKHTTDRLFRKLNQEQAYFTPAEMLEAGFPAFVVERIRLQLETNLADSIVPPSTEWASMHPEEVTTAWQQFLDAINNQLRLPGSFAKGEIETAVAELMDILVEPRKNLPAYLFVTNDELPLEEVHERIRWVVVYQHLGQFLPRYMKTKQLTTISPERYRRAVSQIDEKLCLRYSPPQWAKLLEPLFLLGNGEIEPQLLTLFFRDKQLPAIAQKLERLKDPVDSHELIEILSKPDFDQQEDSEFVPAATFSKSRVNKYEDTEATPSIKPASTTEADTETNDTEDKAPLYTTILNHTDEDDEEDDFRPKQKAGEVNEGEELDDELGYREGEPSLYSHFQQTMNEDEDDTDEPEEEEEDKVTPDDFMADTQDYDTAKTEADDSELTPHPTDSIMGSIDPEEEVEGEEVLRNDPDYVPLWQRLSSASEEEDEQDSSDFRPIPEEQEDESWRDRVETPGSEDKSVTKLKRYLSNNERTYIREIFKNDEEAYTDALHTLAEFNAWRDAGKYLTNSIFRKNKIDMYKDVTVDFTDRLHKFFSDHKGR